MRWRRCRPPLRSPCGGAGAVVQPASQRSPAAVEEEGAGRRSGWRVLRRSGGRNTGGGDSSASSCLSSRPKWREVSSRPRASSSASFLSLREKEDLHGEEEEADARARDPPREGASARGCSRRRPSGGRSTARSHSSSSVPEVELLPLLLEDRWERKAHLEMPGTTEFCPSEEVDLEEEVVDEVDSSQPWGTEKAGGRSAQSGEPFQCPNLLRT